MQLSKHKLFLIVLVVFTFYPKLWAQENKDLKLTNALVIAQQDDLSDRYSIEGGIVRLFTQYHIKAIPALNYIKEGGSPDVLLNDSIQKILAKKGIDTYLLVSIRGYDKKFNLSEENIPFDEALKQHNLYSLYRDGVTRVTFSLKFYRNGKVVHKELIRTGSVGSSSDVMKKLLKILAKRIEKNWN